MTDATKKKVQVTLEDHRKLHKILQELRDYLGQARPEIDSPDCQSWASGLCQQFLGLHERLVVHFRLEEEGGVFAELAEQFPHAALEIEALLGDHGEILDQIRGVTEATMSYSAGKAPDDARLRRRSQALIDLLERHEETETDLMQRLVYEDHGVVD